MNQYVKLLRVSIVLLFFLSWQSSALAWSNHHLITYLSLNQQPQLQRTVPSETLQHFLQQEQQGIARLLASNENWAKTSIAFYKPRPDKLIFQDNRHYLDLPMAFIHALRISPEVNLSNYVIALDQQGNPLRRTRSPSMFYVMCPSMLSDTYSSFSYATKPIRFLAKGEEVKIIDVISTASEEPDLGFDVAVFENNHTEWGKLYEFGEQPWGDANLITTSQGPFHMSFDYENPLAYRLSSIGVSYAYYRIYTYLALSRYAFKTGHRYWGYRFLGWGLHYLQDMTQPYHTHATPNISFLKIASAQALSLIGISGWKNNLVQILANKHWAAEDYVSDHLLYCRGKNQKSSLVNALNHQDFDPQIQQLSLQQIFNSVTKRSFNKANQLDGAIQAEFPERYKDPKYQFNYLDAETDLFCIVSSEEQGKNNQTNTSLNDLLNQTGILTRSIVKKFSS